jgi:hypothetical protein
MTTTIVTFKTNGNFQTLVFIKGEDFNTIHEKLYKIDENYDPVSILQSDDAEQISLNVLDKFKRKSFKMFNDADVKLMSSCIANYIELATNQKDNLTIGSPDCSTLIEFYDNQIQASYILQKKVNSLLIETLKQS